MEKPAEAFNPSADEARLPAPSPLRIAMIGARGVPATVGGVEKIVEQLALQLVRHGHEVTVYCRRNYTGPSDLAPTWQGVRRRFVPAVPGKYTETLSHAAYALIDAMGRGFDVLHLHSLGTAPLLPLARIARARVLFHIHGQEWRGGKWGPAACRYFKACEWPALRGPHEVVVINRELQRYYREKFGREPHYIPNAVEVPPVQSTGILAELGVAPRGFLLFVGRLVPEKGCHYLLRAWRQLAQPLPLVIVGDSSHSDGYVAELRGAAGTGVRFAGTVTGDRLIELYAQALMLVHPSEREGMSLVLLEAMGQGACVLASDIPEMLEGLGGTGYHFRSGDAADLARELRGLLDRPERIEAMRLPAQIRVREHYAWEPVTARFIALYRRLVA